jgi:hypothetical protein
MGHILVTTDQFLVGGRESYLETYLSELRGSGYQPSLLAGRVEAGVPALRVFGDVRTCGGDAAEARLGAWLREGLKHLAQTPASAIWAQHYDLVPAWLLSRITRTPLLGTFHGPLTGAGRPNDMIQATGMALAVHRGDLVSAVSTEAAASIVGLAPGLDVAVLPNAVRLTLDAPGPAACVPRRVLLVARREKLEHLRWGVLLFAAYQRRVPGARLAILSAESPDECEPRRRLGHLRRGLRLLGARWCHGERRRLWRALPRVRWLGYTPDPRSAARQAELVFGMGRALLEGLAEGRPGVLVGYDRVCGLVTARSFGAFAATNFSGRGVPPRDPQDVCAEILGLSGSFEPPDLSALGASRCTDFLRRILGTLEYRGTSSDEELARDCASGIESGRGPAWVFGRIARSLSPLEFQSLYRLASG